jgi:hypothetical protein
MDVSSANHLDHAIAKQNPRPLINPQTGEFRMRQHRSSQSFLASPSREMLIDDHIGKDGETGSEQRLSSTFPNHNLGADRRSGAGPPKNPTSIK